MRRGFYFGDNALTARKKDAAPAKAGIQSDDNNCRQKEKKAPDANGGLFKDAAAEYVKCCSQCLFEIVLFLVHDLFTGFPQHDTRE